MQGPMTPQLLYDLIYLATGDINKATQAQIKLELAQMPEPKNVK
jgi:hypothetical protein